MALARPPQLDESPAAPLPGVIGASAAMAEVYRTTRQVPTVHLTRNGFVVRTATAASDGRDAEQG